MFADAVATVEIVDHVAIDAALDASLGPSLQDLPPVRIVEASPVFRHTANLVLHVLAIHPIGRPFEEIVRVSDRFRAEFLFVPQVAIELEKTTRAVFAVGIADEELDVEMSDGFDVPLVEFAVHPLEPVAAFFEPLHRQMRRIASVLISVTQTPEVRAVKADLRDFGLALIHERQVILVVAVGVPMGNHPRKFKSCRRLGGGEASRDREPERKQ